MIPSKPALAIAPIWAQTAASNHIDIDEDVLRALVRFGHKKRWREGQVIIHVGDKPDHISVCLSGKFRVVMNSIDGHSLLIRFLLPGEIFGLPSVLADAAFPTDLICAEDGETIQISRNAVAELLKTEAKLAMSLITALSVRVAELFKLMEAHLLPSLRARVHQRLIMLAKVHGVSDKLGNIRLNLSQQDIAQSVNASRQKVQVELKLLEREGYLQLGYRNVTLLKRQDNGF